MQEKLIGSSAVGFANRGLFYGENIFTSFATFEGRVLFLDDHIFRLKKAISDLYPELLGVEALLSDFKDFVLETTKKLTCDLYLRATPLVSLDKRQINLHVLFKNYDPCAKFEKSLTLVQRDWERCYFNHDFKLGNYAESFRILNNVRENSFDDFLKVNCDGYILEASTSNIIFEKSGIWYTPKKNNNFLSGIVLNKIKKLYPKKIFEKDIKIDELENFEKSFLTNAVDFIVNVKNIETIFFENCLIDNDKSQTIKKLFMWEKL